MLSRWTKQKSIEETKQDKAYDIEQVDEAKQAATDAPDRSLKLEEEPEHNESLEKFFSCLPDYKSYPKATCWFIISGFNCLLMISSLIRIWTQTINFIIMLTVATFSMVMGLAWINKPRTYIIKICRKEFLLKTIVLAISILGGFWFTLI